jgi:hypothetical protein
MCTISQEKKRDRQIEQGKRMVKAQEKDVKNKGGGPGA